MTDTSIKEPAKGVQTMQTSACYTSQTETRDTILNPYARHWTVDYTPIKINAGVRVIMMSLISPRGSDK